jgi:hypothetical protein
MNFDPEYHGRAARAMTPAEAAGDSNSTVFNWRSLKALAKADRTIVRGAIGYYADLHDRLVPVEIVIPPILYSRSSTNADDVRAREKAERNAQKINTSM